MAINSDVLLAHKMSPLLPRRLAKNNAIFCCIWIVKFNIGKTGDESERGAPASSPDLAP